LQYHRRLLKLTAIICRKERAALEPVKTRSLEEIKQELKQLFVENLSLEELKPEDIKDDMSLFGEGGVGLDSLDGVEIVVLLRRQYGLDVKAMQKGRDIFRSINTLAPYVLAHATK
jgi:acyl carrier protein